MEGLGIKALNLQQEINLFYLYEPWKALLQNGCIANRGIREVKQCDVFFQSILIGPLVSIADVVNLTLLFSGCCTNTETFQPGFSRHYRCFAMHLSHLIQIAKVTFGIDGRRTNLPFSIFGQ